jgi:predicted dehydrogenase
MGSLDKINVGVVGVCGAVGRGRSMTPTINAVRALKVHALCDSDAEGLSQANSRLNVGEIYTDYYEMLERSDLQAVFVATPMHLHVPYAIDALARGLHVLSEVPAGVTLEECRELVRACRESDAVYMIAENNIYTEPNATIREMVRRGEFGTPYYAEAEYIHELRLVNEQTPWRRKWQTGINGITYGTHSLGVVLQWFPGDRVTAVCCSGSGHHYRDARGVPYEAEDCSVMLCKMRNGGLVKIRVDMISDAGGRSRCLLQGTDGWYENETVWLRSLNENHHEGTSLDSVKEQFMPDFWRTAPTAAREAGHGGSDYFQLLDWVDAIRGQIPCPLGIHEAMDMTLPGLISQQSIERGGEWLTVPDSRDW